MSEKKKKKVQHQTAETWKCSGEGFLHLRANISPLCSPVNAAVAQPGRNFWRSDWNPPGWKPQVPSAPDKLLPNSSIPQAPPENTWNLGMEWRKEIFFFPPSFDFRENATKFLLQFQVEFFLSQFEIYMINCSLFLPNSPVGSRNPLWVWRSSHGESFPPSLAEAGAVTPPTAHPAPALPALTVTMTRFCPFCELREQGKILVKHINSLKNILEKRFCF